MNPLYGMEYDSIFDHAVCVYFVFTFVNRSSILKRNFNPLPLCGCIIFYVRIQLIYHSKFVLNRYRTN